MTRALEKVKIKDFLKLLENFNKISLTEDSFKEKGLKEKFNLMLDAIRYIKEMLKSSVQNIRENKEYKEVFDKKDINNLQEKLYVLKKNYENIKELKGEEKTMFEKEGQRILKELKKMNFFFILSKYNYESKGNNEIEKLGFDLREDQKELMEKLNDVYIIQQKIKYKMNEEKMETLKKKDLENIELTMVSLNK
jgi:hypothetical protein